MSFICIIALFYSLYDFSWPHSLLNLPAVCMYQGSFEPLTCLQLAMIFIEFDLYMYQGFSVSFVCLKLATSSIVYGSKIFCPLYMPSVDQLRANLSFAPYMPLVGHDLHCFCLVYPSKLFCTHYMPLVGQYRAFKGYKRAFMHIQVRLLLTKGI